jgi:hypothetical protein
VSSPSWIFTKGVWFLDLQTTGTAPETDHIIEVAWTRLMNPLPLEHTDHDLPQKPAERVWSLIVRPPDAVLSDKRRLNRTSRLTGLRAEQLNEGSSLEDVWQLICETIPDQRAPCLIHYAAFERRFLGQLSGGKPFPYPIVCTYDLSRHVFPDLPSKSLRAVAGHLHHVSQEQKRAAAHVEAGICIGSAVLTHFLGMGITDTQLLTQYLSEHKAPIRGRTLTGTRIDRTTRLALPKEPGIYRFVGPKDTTLYVGKATSIKSRINSYFHGRSTKGSRLHEMLSQAKALGTLTVTHPMLASLVEAEFIKLLDPPYNRALRAGQRSIAYLRIDPGKPQQARVDATQTCSGHEGELVLGPFPNKNQLEHQLNMIRKCFFPDDDTHLTWEAGGYLDPFSAETFAEARILLLSTWQISDEEFARRPFLRLAGAARRLLTAQLYGRGDDNFPIGAADPPLDPESIDASEDEDDAQSSLHEENSREDAEPQEEAEQDSPRACAARVRGALRAILRESLTGKRLQVLQTCTIALCTKKRPKQPRLKAASVRKGPGRGAVIFHFTEGRLNPKGVIRSEAQLFLSAGEQTSAKHNVRKMPDPVLGAWMQLRADADKRMRPETLDLLRIDQGRALLAELKRLCPRDMQEKSMASEAKNHQSGTRSGAVGTQNETVNSVWIKNAQGARQWIPAQRFLHPIGSMQNLAGSSSSTNAP